MTPQDDLKAMTTDWRARAREAARLDPECLQVGYVYATLACAEQLDAYLAKWAQQENEK